MNQSWMTVGPRSRAQEAQIRAREVRTKSRELLRLSSDVRGRAVKVAQDAEAFRLRADRLWRRPRVR